MRRIMQMLALTSIVLLSTLSTAGAEPGDCHIECRYGGSWQGPASSGECCQIFATVCDNYGTAYLERELPWQHLYCPSYG